MASSDLDSVPGYHNIKSAEARELLLPHMQSDGYYLLRPSSDNKGGVLCTICVTNRCKLVNYRLVRDPRSGLYYIHSNNSFPSIQHLLSHYKTTPINSEVNTRLLNPVLSEEQQRELARSTAADDTYVIMERGNEDAPGNQDTSMETIPGLHLFLPKGEINTVMSKYLSSDGNYLVRPSASSEGQLTLAVSNGGKVLNFKIVDNGGHEFYISSRRKFPSVHALLAAYKTTPIKSKKSISSKIFLLFPIPVDKTLEQQHRNQLESKAAKRASSPPPPSQDSLPAPWQCHMHEQYKKSYYYNPNTKESTWERPKATPPVPVPENGHDPPPVTGRKMRGRPLPSMPGNTTPTHQATSPRRRPQSGSAESAPPLPDRTELRPHPQNGIARGMTMPGQRSPRTTPRERMPVPQLPPKEGEVTTPPPGHSHPPLPPKEQGMPHRASVGSRPHSAGQHPHAMSTRPPMPLPGSNAPSLPNKPHPALPSDHAPSHPDRQQRAVPPLTHASAAGCTYMYMKIPFSALVPVHLAGTKSGVNFKFTVSLKRNLV